MNNVPTESVEVVSGVPQGSVLKPLLFLLFINDIVVDLSVCAKHYADDCILYVKVCSVDDEVHLKYDLAKVFAWCEKWKMVINFDKTVYMRITNKKKDPIIINMM